MCVGSVETASEHHFRSMELMYTTYQGRVFKRLKGKQNVVIIKHQGGGNC